MGLDPEEMLGAEATQGGSFATGGLEGGWADDLLLYHVTPALPQPAEEWGRSEDDVKRRTFVLGVPAAFLFSRAGVPA